MMKARIDDFIQHITTPLKKWKEEQVWSLLHGEKITKKAIEHCLDFSLIGNCDCKYHKGIYEGNKFIVYIRPYFVGVGHGEPEWLVVRRKDEIWIEYKKAVLFTFDLSEKKILETLKFGRNSNEFIIIPDTIYNACLDIQQKWKHLSIDIENIAPMEAKCKILEYLGHIVKFNDELKPPLKSLLNIQKYMDKIFKELTKPLFQYEIYHYKQILQLKLPFLR